MDPQGPTGPAGSRWQPPDAGASRAAAPAGPSGAHVEVEEPDGPPVPPPVRRRRRRRRVLLVLAAVVVIGVPVGLAVAGSMTDEGDEATDDDTPPGSAEGPDENDDADSPDPDDGGEPGTGEDGADVELERPDLDGLDGTDAVYGGLLIDVDRSEQVMIGFQDEVASAFATPPDSAEAVLDEVRRIASSHRDDLLEVRGDLQETLPDAGADEVRARYVEHLDSWATYLDAIAEDPAVLAGDDTSDGYNVVINATADAFARALEEELPDDTDTSVRSFADGLLERGFRGRGEAQV